MRRTLSAVILAIAILGSATTAGTTKGDAYWRGCAWGINATKTCKPATLTQAMWGPQSNRLWFKSVEASNLDLLKWHKWVEVPERNVQLVTAIERGDLLGLMGTGGKIPVPAAGGCVNSATYIARLTSPSGPEITAYQNLICGLTTDGQITGNLGSTGCGATGNGWIDVLAMFATTSRGNAVLNICGTAQTLVEQAGPITFTADNGFTPNGTTQYLTINNYELSSTANTCGNGAATCNISGNSGASLTFAAYAGTSRSANNSSLYGYQTTNFRTLAFNFSNVCGGANTTAFTVHDSSGSALCSSAVTDPRGLYLLYRNGALSNAFLRQYQSGGPVLVTDTNTCPLGCNFDNPTNTAVGAIISGGSPGSFSSDIIQMFVAGKYAGSTAAYDTFSTRVNQFMIDVSATYHY